MTAWLLNVLIFLFRFADDPAFAMQYLKSPNQKMDVATIFPLAMQLPGEILTESSGLMVAGQGRLWSHNDSGGKAEIYEIDSNGKLVRILPIPNAENKDWEDLALDRTGGNLYIGDFGNNVNKRRDLKIYKIQNMDKTDSIRTDTISFTYPDQKGFPPPKTNMNFDCEAFVFFHDSLYLFSKNRFTGNGFSKRYRLPASSGNYEAELLDSFFINNVVTSADLNPDNNRLALLTYGAIYIFSDFDGDNFFSGNLLKINIPLSQAEGITFYDNNTIYYSSEEGYLFKINLDNLNIKQPVFREKYHEPELKIITNPCAEKLKIKLKEKDFNKYTASLIAPDKTYVINYFKFTSGKLVINTENLRPGIYKLQLKDADGNIIAYNIRIRAKY